MSGQEQEQDRTEEATPFKLRKAREKGQVARGMDLGFVGSLLAFTAFVLFAGPDFVQPSVPVRRRERERAALEIYWVYVSPEAATHPANLCQPTVALIEKRLSSLLSSSLYSFLFPSH